MAIRKRVLPSGKTAWLAEYRDGAGARRFKQFALKKDADTYLLTVRGDVRDGKHVAARASTTVGKAADMWLKSCDAAGLERATIRRYRQHVDLHIKPHIGSDVASKVMVPRVREFEDQLREASNSPAMIRGVMTSMSSIYKDAIERGYAARNPVSEFRRSRGSRDRKVERRARGKVVVGVDIPTRDEVKAIVGASAGRWRPLLMVAAFCGLRASELRGLRWVDIEAANIHVRQRADRFNEIGPPKSEAGFRTVPLPSPVAAALDAWRKECPKGELVFPNGSGNVERLSNLVQRGYNPAQIAAGIVNQEGKAKYGMHALRHFFASWLINRPADGGLGLPLKTVQERMGHSSVAITGDVYGHMFPRGDDAAELAAGVSAILD